MSSQRLIRTAAIEQAAVAAQIANRTTLRFNEHTPAWEGWILKQVQDDDLEGAG